MFLFRVIVHRKEIRWMDPLEETFVLYQQLIFITLAIGDEERRPTSYVVSKEILFTGSLRKRQKALSSMKNRWLHECIFLPLSRNLFWFIRSYDGKYCWGSEAVIVSVEYVKAKRFFCRRIAQPEINRRTPDYLTLNLECDPLFVFIIKTYRTLTQFLWYIPYITKFFLI